jgi:quercetin 2,3-dioxygenase
MKKIITRANERGIADHGWLKPAHYFSFGGWQNPSKVHFGALRVLNDDWIAGGGAFPTHPHDNMEIVTIPFTGALKHKDSTGAEGVIQAGDIQIMSAGTGVQHSEANESATDPVTLFQLWVFPKEKNITPRYDQRTFDIKEREGKWQVVVSPLEKDNALWINQDARFALTNEKAKRVINYNIDFLGNGVFIVVINGAIEIDGEIFNTKDAVGIWATDKVEIKIIEDAQLLAVEVPM